jgi:hypothetical protein
MNPFLLVHLTIEGNSTFGASTQLNHAGFDRLRKALNTPKPQF